MPRAVVALIAALAAVHAIRVFLLTPENDLEFLLLFAFIPARYDTDLLLEGALPGGIGAQIWTFVTYAFIHANLAHLGMNSVWLLPFGSALGRRLGGLRFFIFFATTAAAGALVHLIAHAGEIFPVIGASAAVSGMMAASLRFAFQPGVPLGWRGEADKSYLAPAVPLLTALREPRVLAFLVAWFGVNLLFGVGSLPIGGVEERIAWEAHIGGFLAGLLLFAAFDPARASDPIDNDGEAGHQ